MAEIAGHPAGESNLRGSKITMQQSREERPPVQHCHQIVVIDDMNAALRVPIRAGCSDVEIGRPTEILQAFDRGGKIPNGGALAGRALVAGAMRGSIQRLEAREVENHPLLDIIHIAVCPRRAPAHR